MLAALAAAVLAAGCAATQASEAPVERAQRIEPLLQAAGFQVLKADTPERRAQLAALTPLQIRFTPEQGRMRYWFADPYYCNCIYTGDQAQYAAYEKTAEQSQLAGQQDLLTQMTVDAATSRENMTFLAWPADEIFY